MLISLFFCLWSISRFLKWLFLTIFSSCIITFWEEDLLSSSLSYSGSLAPVPPKLEGFSKCSRFLHTGVSGCLVWGKGESSSIDISSTFKRGPKKGLSILYLERGWAIDAWEVCYTMWLWMWRLLWMGPPHMHLRHSIQEGESRRRGEHLSL